MTIPEDAESREFKGWDIYEKVKARRLEEERIKREEMEQVQREQEERLRLMREQGGGPNGMQPGMMTPDANMRIRSGVRPSGGGQAPSIRNK